MADEEALRLLRFGTVAEVLLLASSCPGSAGSVQVQRGRLRCDSEVGKIVEVIGMGRKGREIGRERSLLPDTSRKAEERTLVQEGSQGRFAEREERMMKELGRMAIG